MDKHKLKCKRTQQDMKWTSQQTKEETFRRFQLIKIKANYYFTLGLQEFIFHHQLVL